MWEGGDGGMGGADHDSHPHPTPSHLPFAPPQLQQPLCRRGSGADDARTADGADGAVSRVREKERSRGGMEWEGMANRGAVSGGMQVRPRETRCALWGRGERIGGPIFSTSFQFSGRAVEIRKQHQNPQKHSQVIPHPQLYLSLSLSLYLSRSLSVSLSRSLSRSQPLLLLFLSSLSITLSHAQFHSL
jgi:hypothetical protein